MTTSIAEGPHRGADSMIVGEHVRKIAKTADPIERRPSQRDRRTAAIAGETQSVPP